MTYEEFDSMYNKYDNKGVCIRCSYIDMNGFVLSEGTPEEVEEWYAKAIFDSFLTIKWFDDPTAFMGRRHKVFCGDVEMFGVTNLGKSCFDIPYYKEKLEQL